MQNQVPKYPGTSLPTQGLFVDFALGRQASQTTRVTDVQLVCNLTVQALRSAAFRLGLLSPAFCLSSHLPPLCLTFLSLHDLENQAKVRMTFWPSLPKELDVKSLFLERKLMYVCMCCFGRGLEKKE